LFVLLIAAAFTVAISLSFAFPNYWVMFSDYSSL
jgi:hypothetical protein